MDQSSHECGHPDSTEFDPAPNGPPLQEPPLPKVIGKYRVLAKLDNGGGQAEVFRALNPDLPGLDVVIKWARQTLPDHLQRKVIEEGQKVAMLNDSGIVRVHDAGVHEGRPFLVLEYIPGRSLSRRLHDEGCPTLRESAALVARIARALAVAHRQGVWHLDLKPANIVIDTTGRPRIVDFGLARMTQPWNDLPAQDNSLSGTLAYMAPEQAHRRTEHIGPRTDIFGLGAILYALLTNRPLYQAGDHQALLKLAQEAKVTPPRQINANVPPELERICLKALAADPEQRYRSALDLERDLRGFLEPRPSPTPVRSPAEAEPAPIGRPQGHGLKKQRLLLGCLVGLPILAVLGAYFGGYGFEGSRSAPIQAPPDSTEPALPTSATSAPAPTVAEVPQVVDFRIRHYQGDTFRLLGEIGDASHAVRCMDLVRVQADLSAPGYSYLIALNPDGGVEPCYPEDEASPPPRASRIDFPEDTEEFFVLSDGEGLQAFVLVVSRRSLPPLPEWLASLGGLPWEPTEVPDVWRHDGRSLEPIQGDHRGSRVTRTDTPGPLAAVCRVLNDHPDVEAIHALAFPVRPQDDGETTHP